MIAVFDGHNDAITRADHADIVSGRAIAHKTSANASAIAAMAFSGDGAKLATADREGTVKIWADEATDGARRIVLINKDLRNQHIVLLSVPGGGPGTIEQLTAPSSAFDLFFAGASIEQSACSPSCRSWNSGLPGTRLPRPSESPNGGARRRCRVTGTARPGPGRRCSRLHAADKCGRCHRRAAT